MRQSNSMKWWLLVLVMTSLSACNCEPSEGVQSDNETLQKRIINPGTWQDTKGFVQANEVTGVRRMLFTAGQVSVDHDGQLLYPNNMEKQIMQVMDNMEELLAKAGFDLSDVVRFTYYTTDVAAFTKVNVEKQVLQKRLAKVGCRPATSLIGVNELFHPDCVVEIEATVVD